MRNALRIIVAALVVLVTVGASAPAAGADVPVTYTIGTAGDVSTDIWAFGAHVGETLGDSRGWSLGGSLDFQATYSDPDLRILIAEPSVIGSISGCSAQWSCHVSGTVYINETRWNEAAAGWSLGLDAYRHYVVNHEVGHYLGLGHRSCGGTGEPAPVMAQQSIETHPCVNNVWPLPAERQAVADRYGVPVRTGDAAEFVDSAYRTLLHRPGTERAAEATASRLARGEIGEADVVAGVVSSAEFDAVSQSVGRLYYAAFQRPPDPGGAETWGDAIQGDRTRQDVAAAFLRSAEFRTTYGDTDPEEYVRLLYENALGRDPEPSGLDYWTGRIESGELTRSEVLDAFAHSREHRQRRDLDVEVALHYALILDRTAAAGDVDHWTGFLQDGGSRVTMAESFLASPRSVL